MHIGDEKEEEKSLNEAMDVHLNRENVFSLEKVFPLCKSGFGRCGTRRGWRKVAC